MKKAILTCLLVLLAGTVFAGTTVVKTGLVIEITAIDADWYWTDIPGADEDGIYVEWIVFLPGAASDKMSISWSRPEYPELFPSVPRSATTDGQIIYYNGKRIKPVIDYSDCTLNAGHKVTIFLSKDF